jgi:hypothetical protein
MLVAMAVDEMAFGFEVVGQRGVDGGKFLE